jgi:hypothetical protein
MQLARMSERRDVGRSVRKRARRTDARLGIWNYAGSLACDGHREKAEEEALAEKHYRLIPVPGNV